jgi:hypothetical protein
LDLGPFLATNGRFPKTDSYGDGITNSDYWSNRPVIFRQIADAFRTVGTAEDLLYPGVPSRGKVASLYPYSSKLWDDFEKETSYYENEVRYLHIALIQTGYTVDIADEQDISAGALAADSLRNYAVLYIVGPNVHEDIQKDIVEKRA